MVAKQSVVILGAGASVEAGKPTAAQLTEQLLQSGFKKNSTDQFLGELFHLVTGSILQGRAARNMNPLKQKVSIEELAGAIKFLKNRHFWPLRTLFGEIAPYLLNLENKFDQFVKLDSNHMPLDSPYRFFEDDLKSKNLNSPARWDLDFHYWTQGLYGIAFEYIRQFVVSKVEEPTTSTRYLEPLVKADQVACIATLNYDGTIEEAAQTAGIAFDLGVKSWKPGRLGPLDSGQPLLKLHGSIDWVWPFRGPQPGRKQIEIGKPSMGFLNDESCFIFGGENKLTADGPFLDLLKSFEKFLDDACQVYVIGYSFSDKHINDLLATWIGNGNGRKLSIANGKTWFDSEEEYNVFSAEWPFDGFSIEWIDAGEAIAKWFPDDSS